jgi:NifB/MoaA-like Fe-S oxidoreductase
LSDLWNLGEAVLSAAVVPVGITQFSHLYTGKPMDGIAAGALLDHVARWSERARSERGENWVYGSDELYLLAERDLPPAGHYGDFSQIENGIGAVASLRLRLDDGLGELPRMDGSRIGVVTGKAMAALMPELMTKLELATGATFELIVAESSLFGPTITTAGLIVGADIKRVLADRHDLSIALIPAETINDDGIFLDDIVFDELQRSLPIPVFPSYDFIDVLAAETEAVAA